MRQHTLHTLLLAATLTIGLAGCAEPKTEPSMEQRQSDALKDPYSYGPDVPMTGGRKTAPVAQPQQRDDSLKGEWGRFWNP